MVVNSICDCHADYIWRWPSAAQPFTPLEHIILYSNSMSGHPAIVTQQTPSADGWRIKIERT